MTTEPPTAATATPHGTPAAPHVSVRGEARLETAPEIARLDITVTARGTDRQATLDDLTRRHNAVLDLLRTHEPAVEKTESGALVVAPELAKGRGERVRAHHGHARLTATLTDFTDLGRLAARLAALDLTRLDGPWWSLRPDSPAHRDARTQAVRDAVRRAREYADALGAQLVALLELADEGLDTGVVHRARAFGAAAPAPGGAPSGEPAELDLVPRTQTVHAQVTAVFTMTPPDLRG
ncbi:SIMPL domain-containing protein [Streptomyces sp. ICBB 8177]|uniref:SIMPL domain-containing protein n=1 Tax=Streptomyces sp. ICBB 8177 TaxID=563922 RepID=UPI000D67A139|nr:SIMPL domain-containing protein [Streptomyces sp. ICBB 8177]PWI43475.1 hypothetical protein CK485_15170 [Streptomyces sp. ICBB 8177]